MRSRSWARMRHLRTKGDAGEYQSFISNLNAGQVNPHSIHSRASRKHAFAVEQDFHGKLPLPTASANKSDAFESTFFFEYLGAERLPLG